MNIATVTLLLLTLFVALCVVLLFDSIVLHCIVCSREHSLLSVGGMICPLRQMLASGLLHLVLLLQSSRAVPDSLSADASGQNEYFITLHRLERENNPAATTSELFRLWPRPVSLSLRGTSQYLLDELLDFRTAAALSDCDVIADAVRRYSAILNDLLRQTVRNWPLVSPTPAIYLDANRAFPKALPRLSKVHLMVSGEIDCGSFPEFENDTELEAYSIEVRDNAEDGEAVLLSSTQWGLLRGLETLSQLFQVATISFPNPSFQTESLNQTERQFVGLVLGDLRLSDRPRMAYRGLMIDTARHWLPPELIVKTLDAMSYVKLNSLHWHLSDDQAFSLSVESLPDVRNYGSRRTYSVADVEGIVQAGRLRGIQVVPEIDSPAHSQALAAAIPGSLVTCPNGRDALLNPTAAETLDAMWALLAESSRLFPNRRFHIGFDDVDWRCWTTNQSVRLFMEQSGLSDGRALEQYYLNWLTKQVKALGKKPIVWQDPLDEGVQVPEGTLVQAWKDRRNWPGHDSWTVYLQRILDRNHSVVFSSCWQLSEMLHAKHWQDLYSCDPLSLNITKEQTKLIIGGEACLWSDFVDATNLEQVLWPKVAAVAERLWSSAENTETTRQVQTRLNAQRCRLLSRGIAASPVEPGHCDWEGDLTTEKLSQSHSELSPVTNKSHRCLATNDFSYSSPLRNAVHSTLHSAQLVPFLFLMTILQL